MYRALSKWFSRCGAALAVVVCAALFTCCGGEGTEQDRVAVISLLEIEPIRLLREGFAERLGEYDSESFELDYFNASNDSAMLADIVSRVQSLQPRAVYALGTSVSQSLKSQAPELLVLQGAATDPVSAGLAESWAGSGRNYIATSDRPSLKSLLDFCQEAFPGLERISVPFNPAESNSVAILNLIRKEAETRGITLDEVAISGSSDYLAVSSRLMSDGADLILVPPDNTVFAFISSLARDAFSRSIPLVATTEDAVEAGAVISLAIDYRQLGKDSAELLIRVFEGEKPETLPISYAENPDVVIKKDKLSALGVKDSVLAEREGLVIK